MRKHPGPGPRDCGSVAVRRVPGHSAASEISELLSSDEISQLIENLDGLRWTGRKGSGAHALIGRVSSNLCHALPALAA